MNTTELTATASSLADDLAPDAVDGGSGIGFLLAKAEAIVDDENLAAVMVAGFRLTTIGNYLMAAAANRAQTIGMPVRQKVKTGRDLLGKLPLAPAAVGRLGRLGDNLAALPNVVREVRDGDLSLDHADAVIRGVSHVGRRLDVDGFNDARKSIERALLVEARWGTPAQVMGKARTIAHELAPHHPPVVPPAENPMLNTATVAQSDEGRVTLGADLDQVSGEKLMTALDALSAPKEPHAGGDDQRTRGQRLADGLVDVLDSYFAHPDRPPSSGAAPSVTVTVPISALLFDAEHDDAGRPLATVSLRGEGTEPSILGTGTSIPRLGFTGAISPGQARELCCGNPALTAILTSDGVPVDVKPTARFATGALREALVVRDCGCQFPGCGRPASWTQAHHIKHWADGGETVLANMVLLCSLHHHTYIHAMGWEVTIGTDGHPWFRAPETKEWIPCHQRRTRGLAAA